MDVEGSLSLPVTLSFSNLTLTEEHYVVVGNSHTITLPDPTNIIGRIYIIKAGNVGNLIITRNNPLTDKIDGSNLNITLAAYKYIQVQAIAASNWIIIGQN